MKPIVFTFLVIFTFALFAEASITDRYKEWCAEFNIPKSRCDGNPKALANFERNLKIIEAHNSKEGVSYTMTLNEFADLSRNQLKDMRSGSVIHDTDPVSVESALQPDAMAQMMGIRDDEELPLHFDWRDSRPECITRVKSQKDCASCYAFGGIAALESHYCIYTGERVEFSEQQTLDCTLRKPYENEGCVGGRVHAIFHYAATFGYLCEEESYPYRVDSEKERCAEKYCKNYRYVGDLLYPPYHIRLPSGDINAIKRAVFSRGPVVFEFATGDNFNYYESGIYTGEEECDGSKPDHTMLIIGWGFDPKYRKHYWIVKNSWNVGWGDAGYVKMEMGKDICGMERNCRYPTMHNMLNQD